MAAQDFRMPETAEAVPIGHQRAADREHLLLAAATPDSR
jgi:hypothetical protein